LVCISTAAAVVESIGRYGDSRTVVFKVGESVTKLQTFGSALLESGRLGINAGALILGSGEAN
jgi:hypothetical protein